MLLVGCNKLKPTEKAEDTATAASEWSCTNQENLNHIQAALKKEYLKQIDRSLRQSDYQSDYDILDKINKGLKFEITNVRTLEAESGEASTTKLNCESQLVISFPKGLQKRAENAYLEEQKEKLRNEKLSAIISVIEEEKEVTSAFKQITTINGIKQYLSAVLFFKFKNEINEYGKLSKSNIPKICAALIDRKIHVSELGLAVSLLGAYFGYQAFYDDYYSMSSLPVFKVKQLPIKEQSTELSPSKLNDKPEEETFNVNDTQEKAGDIYNEPLLIQEIRTLSNKHGSYLKKEMNSEVKKAIQRIDKVVVKNISDTKKYLLTNYGDHVSFGSKELIKIKSVIPGLS